MLALGLAGSGMAAEFRTAYEAQPRVTHVHLMYVAESREYWAWVSLEHEDWPIETRRFLLHPDDLYPDLHDEVEKRDDKRWTVQVSREDLDRVYTRDRKFNSPYRHWVDHWVVLGPKGEKIHRRDIEGPHPGGWPFKLLERGIRVPLGVTKLTFKAHDPIHGYGSKTVTVDLITGKGPDFEVETIKPYPWTGRLPGVKKYFRSNDAENVPDMW